MTNQDAYSSFADDEFEALLCRASEAQVAKLDAEWDFDAGLADVYARAARTEPTTSVSSSPSYLAEPEQHHDAESDAVADVCSHIEMLDVLLATVGKRGDGPVLYGSHVLSVRQYLMQLRIGLSRRQLTRSEAFGLLELVTHALREADRGIHRQGGLSLEQALRDRIGELREINTDLHQQIDTLRDKVMQLFNDANDAASLAPTPH
ncbi:hypothetical protein [Nonomuraea sp. NPDC003804]|uniref:hypothetical protein n=1 Tax=Nonomuraea sp. NPDC003804 TaxID=3154547 RepID=UPI00339E17F2